MDNVPNGYFSDENEIEMMEAACDWYFTIYGMEPEHPEEALDEYLMSLDITEGE